MPKEIRATYGPRKGIAPCPRCPENPERAEAIVTYGRQKTMEDAEKLLYNNWFRKEMELQNERYRKKGNYGRIWTIDEWRTSVRHRPVENLFQIGNIKYFFPLQDLWRAYSQFYDWRQDTFGNAFVCIGVVAYAGCTVTHIHERIVFYWMDKNGIKYTDTDKALAKAGVGLPFPEMPESRDNNRKMMFDRICREKWLDIVEEELRAYPDLKLVRPDPEFKFGLLLDQALKLELGDRRALQSAENRQTKKIDGLIKKLDDLKAKQEAVRSEMDNGDVPEERKIELREEILIVKNKIKAYEQRLEKAKIKERSIQDALNQR